MLLGVPSDATSRNCDHIHESQTFRMRVESEFLTPVSLTGRDTSRQKWSKGRHFRLGCRRHGRMPAGRHQDYGTRNGMVPPPFHSSSKAQMLDVSFRVWTQ